MQNEEKDSTIIFGVRPLEEALGAGTTFMKVYVQKGMGDGLKHIKQILNRHKVNFTEVPKEKLDSLSKFKNHQGVVAKISSITYHNAEELVKRLLDDDKAPFVIALDRVTDVRNFGAIARTAMAAGLDAIINVAADSGVKEAMIGMAHRGRLNVLANIMHKSYESIFDGFEGKLQTSKWAKITKTSTDTALRDIKDLVKKGILQQTSEGGRNANYEMVS